MGLLWLLISMYYDFTKLVLVETCVVHKPFSLFQSKDFGLLFDWIYPAHMPVLLKGISHWADTPEVSAYEIPCYIEVLCY